MKQLREKFTDHVVTGATVEQAMRLALAEAAAELENGHTVGKRLDQIAHALGLRALVDEGLSAVLQFAVTRWMNVPLTILPGRRGVRDIPAPDCIEAQLPKDRPPTRDEVQRAWDLCTAAQHP